MPDLMQEILKSVSKAKNSIWFMLLLKIVSIFQSIEVRLSTAQQLPPSMSSSWVGIDSGFFGE